MIPPEYDSMIAKVIAHGRDRDEALARLHRALSQMTVVVAAARRTSPSSSTCSTARRCAPATIDTSWLDRLTAADEHLPTRLADVALGRRGARRRRPAIAAIDRASFLGWASRGRPRPTSTVGREIELRHGGQSYRSQLRRSAPAASRSSSTGSGRRRRRRAARSGRSRLIDRRAQLHRRVVASRAATTSSRSTASPTASPATTPASSGRRPPRWSSASTWRPDDVVEAGDRLGVVEAMKMEIAVPAPVAGRVRDVFVARNVQVDAGAPLFRIEPVGDDAASRPPAVARDRADGAAPGGDGRPRPPRRRRGRGRSCSASTSTGDRRRAPGRAATVGARPRPRSWRSSTPSPTLCAVAPERRAGRRRRRGARGPRALQHLPALARRRGEGLPTGSASGCCAASPTTA